MPEVISEMSAITLSSMCAVCSWPVLLEDRYLFGPRKQPWEAAICMIMRKWKLFFVSGYKCKSQISSTTEFLNSCKGGNYVKHDIEENYVKHGIE